MYQIIIRQILKVVILTEIVMWTRIKIKKNRKTFLIKLQSHQFELQKQ